MLLTVLLSALSFWIVGRVVPGWKVKNFGTAILVALVYGLLRVLAFWPTLLAKLALLPLFILFPHWLIGGLISFALTVLLVVITDKLIEGFEIQDLPTAIVGAFVLNVMAALLRLLFLL